MKLYRIVQTSARCQDLSGTGAYRYGGRWNSKGTYMLYTSETSSLAYLETLVHFDKANPPARLYLMTIELQVKAKIWLLPETLYHKDWKLTGLIENQLQGDTWMKNEKFAGVKVRSAINHLEFNILLNPLFPGLHSMLKVSKVDIIHFDNRCVKD